MGLETLEREISNLRTAVNTILKKVCSTASGTDITDVMLIEPLEEGEIEAGKKSISFQNTGDTEILIKGIEIPSGDVIEFSASPGNVLDAIAYNSQLSTILIITLE